MVAWQSRFTPTTVTSRLSATVCWRSTLEIRFCRGSERTSAAPSHLPGRSRGHRRWSHRDGAECDSARASPGLTASEKLGQMPATVYCARRPGSVPGDVDVVVLEILVLNRGGP